MRLNSHAVIITLVAAALTAPAAQAMPASDPPGQARVAHVRTDTGQLPGPPTWPANPQPLHAVDTESPGGAAVPWEALLFAVLGTGLVLAVGRMLLGVRRRPRVAA
jgi:hypothetical protein